MPCRCRGKRIARKSATSLLPVAFLTTSASAVRISPALSGEDRPNDTVKRDCNFGGEFLQLTAGGGFGSISPI